MLLPIKPICSRPRKDGSSIIFIQYCYSASNRTLLNTQLVISPECWNKRRLCIDSSLPPAYGDADAMNEALRKMLRAVEDLVILAKQKGVHNRGQFVKEHFRPNVDVFALGASSTPKKRLDVFYQLDEYIKSKSRKVTPGMVKVYLNMKALLLAFQEWTNQPITFESFDFNFYEEFVSFLTFDYVQRRRKDRVVGLKVNSIGKTIKQLRIFLRNRSRRKIIPPIDLEDFTIISEDSDAIYLTRQEITKLYNTDLSQHLHLVPYRDLFVLACLTGLRFSDFRSIRPEDIRKGMLHKKQDKSDHWVVIPLRTEAKEVLARHFKSKTLYLTNAEFNRHIKTVGCLAGITETIKFSYKKGNKDIVTMKPKCDWITTHTARRSFCTNEFLAGTPVELIMKISGHKSVKDFYRYIRITPEEAGHKISKIWQQRGEILTSR